MPRTSRSRRRSTSRVESSTRRAASRAGRRASSRAGRRAASSASSRKVSKKRTRGKKTSPWIAHVKSVAKKEGIPYGEALKVAKKTYKK